MEGSGMEIQRLVYRSAPRAPTGAEILDIVRAADRRNPGLGCSGMLFYADGTYAQLVEGPPAGVDALWESLSRDPRHRVLWWRMGGAPGREIDPDLPMGFLSEGEARAATAFSGVLDLLARDLSDPSEGGDGAPRASGLGRALAAAAHRKYPSRALGRTG